MGHGSEFGEFHGACSEEHHVVSWEVYGRASKRREVKMGMRRRRRRNRRKRGKRRRRRLMMTRNGLCREHNEARVTAG